jgi:hypothetical protein
MGRYVEPVSLNSRTSSGVCGDLVATSASFASFQFQMHPLGLVLERHGKKQITF